MFNKAFADYLVNNKIANEDIYAIEEVCDNSSTFLHHYLIDENFLDEDYTYQCLAKFIDVEYKELQLTELNFDLLKIFPRNIYILNRTIPIKQDDRNLYIAISEPENMYMAEELKYYINKNIVYYLATPTRIQETINYINNRVKQLDVLDTLEKQDEISDKTLSDMSETDAPIIALCDSVLKDAVSRGASDIHIEPFENEIIIRYRIDGKLLKVDSIKPSLYPPFLARFKIIADLNIAERRVPQDGKISEDIDGRKYDFRVSTMPTVFGEKIVIRIYNKSLSTSDMSLLGLSDQQKRLITSFITRPHGIILLTGPTGSGKSTSLYTFLRYLNKGDVNITTVEDPVENVIKGITQVQVNPKANLTFSSVLRATLRQDPNIIMIGEIRDEETAHIAVRAAITGHLVLSTIHTNSAASVVTRLIDMGVEPYLVADSLICSVSQRLVRKLCVHCKKEDITTSIETKLLGLNEPKKIYRACGCSVCSNTGYLGRIGIFEILPVTSEVRNIIMSPHFNSEMLQDAMKGKIESITDVARKRVLDGDTTIEEYSSLIEELESSKIEVNYQQNENDSQITEDSYGV